MSCVCRIIIQDINQSRHALLLYIVGLYGILYTWLTKVLYVVYKVLYSMHVAYCIVCVIHWQILYYIWCALYVVRYTLSVLLPKRLVHLLSTLL